MIADGVLAFQQHDTVRVCQFGSRRCPGNARTDDDDVRDLGAHAKDSHGVIEGPRGDSGVREWSSVLRMRAASASSARSAGTPALLGITLIDLLEADELLAQLMDGLVSCFQLFLMTVSNESMTSVTPSL